MRYAMINAGTVINVIVWDGETPFDPGDGVTLIRSDSAQIDDQWDGEKFTTPTQDSG